ncbi:bb3-type cytochrome oxidase subunit III [Variovorax sp. J22P271]|uniref:bb3-type cytochrome oxidase subunit III n=1 Tax=Variovorax davisae TaxID=3053515 RepID=UPI002576ED80|nr:bb3-type cytochrome oxidase subunit III [Variovorax sp. J22P271]MDM0036020.1 bb3-type cytochrome oxidase subunit III [Variovorax sp. J22P271]
MSASATLRAGVARRGGRSPDTRASAAGIGLWVFMGVATALFSLFVMAYLMRMNGSDAVAIALPWQLWLSSALLAIGGVALQRAAAAARHAEAARARRLLGAGGLCALAFLAVQLWAWQALMSTQVTPAGNPGAAFFYLLTAMHGLHVMGGLAAWAWTVHAGWPDPAAAAWRIALCARYWHFLLAVWGVLFALLGWVTPEVARAICGTP